MSSVNKVMLIGNLGADRVRIFKTVVRFATCVSQHLKLGKIATQANVKSARSGIRWQSLMRD